jgi:hypothetical protein
MSVRPALVAAEVAVTLATDNFEPPARVMEWWRTLNVRVSVLRGAPHVCAKRHLIHELRCRACLGCVPGYSSSAVEALISAVVMRDPSVIQKAITPADEMPLIALGQSKTAAPSTCILDFGCYRCSEQ